MSRSYDREDDHIAASEYLVAIVGPTAAGKSALALDVARSLDGAIVNADAMALYRGMDIATDKPGMVARQQVEHHMLDVWPVTTTASVVEYRDAARAAIRQVWSRERVPLVVGGSPLYLKAVCDELDVPPTDPQTRARYQRLLDESGAAAAHRLLADRDPQAAALIEPSNGRRIVRALEVVELTGSFAAALPTPTAWAPTRWIGIRRTREDLDDRITRRVEQWWSQDALRDEVETLLAAGLTPDSTAGKAVGYQQMMAALRGELTMAQARDATITATCKLARRQERTLRSDDRIVWFEGADPDLLVQVLEHLRR